MKNHVVIPGLMIFISQALFGIGNDFIASQRSLIPGARSIFLGGAYTALSDDPSGAYFNPSGLADLKGQSISLSGSAAYANKVVYHKAVKDQDFTEKSEGFFPSFVGGSQKWGSFGIAYALMNLDARDISQNDKFTEISTEESGARTFHRTHQEDNKLVCGGVGIGSLISGGFALGASVFYYQRSIKGTKFKL